MYIIRSFQNIRNIVLEVGNLTLAVARKSLRPTSWTNLTIYRSLFMVQSWVCAPRDKTPELVWQFQPRLGPSSVRSTALERNALHSCGVQTRRANLA